MTVQLKFETHLASEDDLPKGLGEVDRGRTWFIGWVWWIWHGTGWQQAIATRTAPA
jgi:hypothetical protein